MLRFLCIYDDAYLQNLSHVFLYIFMCEFVLVTDAVEFISQSVYTAFAQFTLPYAQLPYASASFTPWPLISIDVLSLSFIDALCLPLLLPSYQTRNKCRISDSFLCIAPFPLIIYFSQVKIAQFELCSTLSEQWYTNRSSVVPSTFDPIWSCARWKFECANIDQDKWTLSSYPCLEYRK